VGWRTFILLSLKGSFSPCSARVVHKFVGNTQKNSNFLQIFLLDPNFLHAHRNRYLEGTDDRQMTTPHGYSNLIPSLKGLSICHHFEFNYILNSHVLSMCFVCYHSWIICTICNAVLMSFFRLGKFLVRISAFPLCPRYIRCCTTCLSPSLYKKMLDHLGVILLNTSVTQTGIFLLRYRNFRCNI
jgi:hypothetical protein